MIAVRTDGRTWAKVEGHAEFAPKGHDIVCSAISVLYQTLQYCLEEQKAGECKEEDGLLTISESDQNTDTLFSFFCTGCQSVAKAYPKHVSYQRV